MGALVTALPDEPVELENSPFVLYLASLSTGSVATQRCGLSKMLREACHWKEPPELFPWHQLRYVHVAALRTWLGERYAPATANRLLCGIRGVLRQAYRLELLSERDYRLASEVEPIRGERLPAGRAIPRGELRALFSASGDRPIDARDVAILAVLYGAGVRRFEARALDLEDVQQGDEPAIRVRGKGNKHRRVFLPRGTVQALSAYLKHRGEDPGPLFWASRTRACYLVPGRRISLDGVRQALIRLARSAGVPHLTPHDLRRTFVGDLLDAGADLSVVSKLAGHANVTTTMRYDRRDERARQAAADLLSVPFEPANDATDGD